MEAESQTRPPSAVAPSRNMIDLHFLHPSHLAVAFIDLHSPPLQRRGENIYFIAYLPIWFYFIGGPPLYWGDISRRYATAQIATTAAAEDGAF